MDEVADTSNCQAPSECDVAFCPLLPSRQYPGIDRIDAPFVRIAGARDPRVTRRALRTGSPDSALTLSNFISSQSASSERQPQSQHPLALALFMQISYARHQQIVQRNHAG